jgi:hypothetical protein
MERGFGREKKMLNVDKKDSSELYEDRETQALLSKFLSGEIKTLEPIYDPKTGYHYPPPKQSSATPTKRNPS